MSRKTQTRRDFLKTTTAAWNAVGPQALNFADGAAVCDVDVVIIVTPDHWHSKIDVSV